MSKPEDQPQLPYVLDDDTPLPAPSSALGLGSVAPGLIAVGPNPSIARLQEAYAQATFPCYGEGELPLWWCPDPRMLLDVDGLRVTRSLRQALRATRVLTGPHDAPPNTGWAVSANRQFEAVITACAQTPRLRQTAGGWILPQLRASYGLWHQMGRAHSIEVWWNGQLTGGLYGVNLGPVFFGESMFSWRSNASKIALAALVAWCKRCAIALIDCQMHTNHLESMGARLVPVSTLLNALPPPEVCAQANHPLHPWHTQTAWPHDLLDDLTRSARTS